VITSIIDLTLKTVFSLYYASGFPRWWRITKKSRCVLKACFGQMGNSFFLTKLTG